jgi:hypothetical protein
MDELDRLDKMQKALADKVRLTTTLRDVCDGRNVRGKCDITRDALTPGCSGARSTIDVLDLTPAELAHILEQRIRAIDHALRILGFVAAAPAGSKALDDFRKAQREPTPEDIERARMQAEAAKPSDTQVMPGMMDPDPSR